VVAWLRLAHNPEVAGSNPAPATEKDPPLSGAFYLLGARREPRFYTPFYTHRRRQGYGNVRSRQAEEAEPDRGVGSFVVQLTSLVATIVCTLVGAGVPGVLFRLLRLLSAVHDDRSERIRVPKPPSHPRSPGPNDGSDDEPSGRMLAEMTTNRPRQALPP
jgi:hypothetical protein